MDKNDKPLRIREAGPEDISLVTALLARLYGGYDPGLLDQEIRWILDNPDNSFLLAFWENEAVGIAHGSIRTDYVEAAGRGRTGYLEALYVDPAFRRRGIGQSLVSALEKWARSKGASLLASDSLIENQASYHFHLGAGFTEKSRTIHYIKELEADD